MLLWDNFEAVSLSLLFSAASIDTCLGIYVKS